MGGCGCARLAYVRSCAAHGLHVILVMGVGVLTQFASLRLFLQLDIRVSASEDAGAADLALARSALAALSAHRDLLEAVEAGTVGWGKEPADAAQEVVASSCVVSEGASLGRVLREVQAMVTGAGEAAAGQRRRMQSMEHELANLRFQVASAAPPAGAGASPVVGGQGQRDGGKGPEAGCEMEGACTADDAAERGEVTLCGAGEIDTCADCSALCARSVYVVYGPQIQQLHRLLEEVLCARSPLVALDLLTKDGTWC